MKILIVEDERLLRELLHAVLFTEKHQVRAFGSGVEALDVLRFWKPDVLISDLELPSVAGEELARVAASLPDPARVILISAHAQRLEGARMLADAVLLKPFDLDDLTSLIQPPCSDFRSRN